MSIKCTWPQGRRIWRSLASLDVSQSKAVLKELKQELTDREHCDYSAGTHSGDTSTKEDQKLPPVKNSGGKGPPLPLHWWLYQAKIKNLHVFTVANITHLFSVLTSPLFKTARKLMMTSSHAYVVIAKDMGSIFPGKSHIPCYPITTVLARVIWCFSYPDLGMIFGVFKEYHTVIQEQ